MKKEFHYKKKMNKSVLIGILVFILIIFIVYTIGTFTNKKSTEVFGDDKVDMFFFHLDTCPFCLKQKKFHKILKDKYPQLNIMEYEISNPKSKALLINFSKDFSKIDKEKISTPTTIIGDEVIIGFASQTTTGKTLINAIEKEITKIEKTLNKNSTRTKNLRE